MKIKDKHVDMIAQLRKDSRIPLTNLSRATRVPVSTLFDQVKKHREYGLIKKFTVLLDYSKLGFNTRVSAAIKADNKDRDELKSFLEKHENVNSLFRINNGYHFLIDCLFRDMNDVEEFKDSLEAKFRIKAMDVHFILDEVKAESFLDSKEKAFVLN